MEKQRFVCLIIIAICKHTQTATSPSKTVTNAVIKLTSANPSCSQIRCKCFFFFLASVALFIPLRWSQMSSPGPPLPPASLHLLVPPVRLMSAFIWQVVQQHSVMQYDKVVDFISLATEIVPELLDPSQKAQLIMNLTAKVRNYSERVLC